MTCDFEKTLEPFSDRTEEQLDDMREHLNQYVRLLVRIAHDPAAQARFDELTKTTFAGTLEERSKP